MRRLFLTQFAVLLVFATFSQSEFSNPTIQVGVVVEDIEKSLTFYTEVIGMKKTGEFTVDGAMGKKLGLSAELPLQVTVLKLEDSPNANEWKLMSFGKKSNHGQQKYVHNDTGMQYITIFVKSVAPFLERLEANNVKLLGETPAKLEDGRSFILVQDPDGTFIELIGNE